MANTIARLVGSDRTRDKVAHRLGSVSSFASAATWHTEARVLVRADGSGVVEVLRDGQIIHAYSFGREGEGEGEGE